jgi:hypothetical protein
MNMKVSARIDFRHELYLAGIGFILSLLGGFLTAWAFMLTSLYLPMVMEIAGMGGLVAGAIVFPFFLVVLRRRRTSEVVGIVYGVAIVGTAILGMIAVLLEYPPWTFLMPFGFTAIGLALAWIYASPRNENESSNKSGEGTA